MKKADVSSPPQLVDPSKMDRWALEKKYYHENLTELLLNYRGKFVAIYQNRVVASGDNQIDVAHAAMRQHGNVPIYIKQVTTEPPEIKRLSFSQQFRRVAKPRNWKIIINFTCQPRRLCGCRLAR